MNIINKFDSKINGILETFDRMIINGYLLNLQNSRQFLYYLIQNNISLKDFSSFAESQTSSLCNNIDDYIKSNNCECIYLKSPKTNKAEIVDNLILDNDINGLIVAFSAVETCNTMTVVKNKSNHKLETASRPTKCKHYYLYYNDFEFGLMFVKIQTWFPYNIQIYINGREYLSKLLNKEDVSFEMHHNSFSYIEDFPKAQALSNKIFTNKISDSFDGLAKKLNNHLTNIEKIFSHTYYWCIDQCEFATDINFKSRKDLELFYKKQVEASYFAFSSEDIYSFFGRSIKNVQRCRKAEITSDLRRRNQGYRIKFKLNKNQIKMYDKGNNLRIEVTINNSYDFKVLKTVENIETGEVITSKKWKPMGKSISNLYRYAEISKSVIKRFIDALPEIDEKTVSLKALNKISSRTKVNERIYSGFNLFDVDTINLFREISKGGYIINGFTNKKIRNNIFVDANDKKVINKVTRLLAKLKAHKLIKKVSKKNKYYLTTKGREILNTFFIFMNQSLLT